MLLALYLIATHLGLTVRFHHKTLFNRRSRMHLALVSSGVIKQKVTHFRCLNYFIFLNQTFFKGLQLKLRIKKLILQRNHVLEEQRK